MPYRGRTAVRRFHVHVLVCLLAKLEHESVFTSHARTHNTQRGIQLSIGTGDRSAHIFQPHLATPRLTSSVIPPDTEMIGQHATTHAFALVGLNPSPSSENLHRFPSIPDWLSAR